MSHCGPWASGFLIDGQIYSLMKNPDHSVEEAEYYIIESFISLN